MKKSITTLALTAAAAMTSVTASAMPEFEPGEKKTVCLRSWKEDDGSLRLDTCNMSHNNKQDQVALLENGCAKDQAAIVTFKDLKIGNCIPSGARQL